MTESSSPFVVAIGAGINRICDELKLTPFVRAKCNEMCSKIEPKEKAKISDPVANAIACAIVSIVHEDAKRNGRVGKHLPDRVIGKVFGLSSITVVHNKHLVNSVISSSLSGRDKTL